MFVQMACTRPWFHRRWVIAAKFRRRLQTGALVAVTVLPINQQRPIEWPGYSRAGMRMRLPQNAGQGLYGIRLVEQREPMP